MILHMDMDAFFTSVEQLDNPSLRGQCVLVGGLSGRGVVAAASYEARKFGIHSAMPMFQARQKCPDAVIVPPRRSRYKELSIKIMNELKQFSPLVEPVSIDEAYVDITGCEKLHGNPERIGRAVKKKIRDTVELTCSVGIAPVKFLAKIASDMDKPDGLTLIRTDQVPAFLESLPVEKVPGVGRKTLGHLGELGIRTLGDVRKHPENRLTGKLGKFGARLMELSLGIDNARVTPNTAPKSISAEETLKTNTRDKALLNRYIMKQAEEVARQLRRKRVKARTVTLKIKHDDFVLVTRRSPLGNPSQTAEAIRREAVRLLEKYNINRDIRLIGVGASGLLPVGTPTQMDLFSGGKAKNRDWEKIDRALDDISRRFGKGVIQRATLEED
jgi:DNA polymerase IV